MRFVAITAVTIARSPTASFCWHYDVLMENIANFSNVSYRFKFSRQPLFVPTARAQISEKPRPESSE
jgi:hypothetical protein